MYTVNIGFIIISIGNENLIKLPWYIYSCYIILDKKEPNYISLGITETLLDNVAI